MAESENLQVRLAKSEEDLIASQKLRYRVFVKELGAGGEGVDHGEGLERDSYDDYYDHLLLVDPSRDSRDLDYVVGVYRLLLGEVAQRLDGFYTRNEYDLSPLVNSGKRLLELGRSCVDRQYRGGAALVKLWAGVAEYVLNNGVDIMFGVASFHGTDVDALATPLSYLHHRHLAPEDIRVSALPPGRRRMDMQPSGGIDEALARKSIPSLIKGYVRLGGFVGEGAFVDEPFNTTDVCVLLDTARMSEKHKGHYVANYSRQK